MSRDIKFRAWDTRRREFLSGGEVFIAIQPGKSPKNIIYLDIIKDPDMYKDRFILQQYTGLKDKNGKEVYEGDIVKALKHNEDLFTDKVWWRSGVLWFGNWNWIEFQNIFRSIEVIGNIYETPNLLESEA